jgi:hypothetical protein
MVAPELALEPVIPPVIAPTVQLKLLAVLAVRAILVEAPLQILFAAELVTTGIGFTVTVIVRALPIHEPPVDVGVTIYSTEPAAELLGLVNTWLIVEAEPAADPVMLPVMVPIVQLKLLAALDVNDILAEAPLHIVFVAAFVTDGAGFTVTVMVSGAPTHAPLVDVAVTMYCTEPGVALLGFVKV